MVEASDFNFTIAPDLSDIPRFQELKFYWDRKRGTRAMPTRADIDPAELREHLGWIYLIEVFSDLSDFRYRLLGSRITEAYGRDSTGKTLSQLYQETQPEYYRTLATLYLTVVRKAVLARGRGTLKIVGKPYRGYDAIYLPLDRGDGSVGMILAEIQIN